MTGTVRPRAPLIREANDERMQNRRRYGYRGGGYPGDIELCEKIVAPDGVIANIGVHGTKVDLY
jgi:hypothetical protein